MTNENNLTTTDNASAEDIKQTAGKKTYVAPKLHRYGGLAELVQIRPARGRDGGRFIDCTLT